MMDIEEASIATRPGRQFSIWSVFLLTAAVAVLTVPVATWGWPGLVLSLWLAAILISLLRPWPSISAILLVESEKYRLHWMSTADASIEMVGPINGTGDTLASDGPHSGFSIGAFCDAHTMPLTPDDFGWLYSLLTIDGDDNVLE